MENVSGPSDAFAHSSPKCLDDKVSLLETFPRAGGAHSDIWMGKLDNETVAIKILRTVTGVDKQKLYQRLWREHRAWSSLRHPNIHKCLGYTYDFTQQTVHIIPALISPWMTNGTLRDYVTTNRTEELDRIRLMIGVGKGLGYLHSQRNPIVHGDLNGGNVLVSSDGTPCLTDFGLSRVLEEQGFTTTTATGGTPRWMAPELFKNQKTTVASDIWAFGMTFLEIVSGKLPYYDIPNNIVVISEIAKGTRPQRPPDTLSPALKDYHWSICNSCWDRRSNISIVVSALQRYLDTPLEQREAIRAKRNIHLAIMAENRAQMKAQETFQSTQNEGQIALDKRETLTNSRDGNTRLTGSSVRLKKSSKQCSLFVHGLCRNGDLCTLGRHDKIQYSQEHDEWADESSSDDFGWSSLDDEGG